MIGIEDVGVDGAEIERWYAEGLPVHCVAATQYGEFHMSDTDEWFEGMTTTICCSGGEFMNADRHCASVSLP